MPEWNEPLYLTWGNSVYLPIALIVALAVGRRLWDRLGLGDRLSVWRWKGRHCGRRPLCDTGAVGVLCGCLCGACKHARDKHHVKR